MRDTYKTEAFLTNKELVHNDLRWTFRLSKAEHESRLNIKSYSVKISFLSMFLPITK